MSSEGDRDRPLARNKWNKKSSSPNRSFDLRNNHKRFNGNGNRGGRFDNGNDMMPNSNGGSGRGNNSMRRRGGGAPQYRSMRNTKSNDNGDSKSPKEIEKSPMSNRWRSGGASTKSKDHYNPAQTKNVYIVSLNEISRCIKFDEPKQPKRDVELRPIDNERANEILEKNLAERKAKMETLNIEVDDSTQELFDFMYRTLPNKCVWSGTTITFPDSKMSIEEPYDSISLNGMTRNKQVDYIEKQVQSFWNKYRKLNPPKKKKQKKKKKTKSPKSQKSSNNQNNNNHNGHNQSPLRGNGGGNSHLQTEGKENNISLNSPNGRTPGNHGNSTFSRNARSSNPNGSPPPKQSQTAGSNLMQTLSPNTQNAANAQGSVGIANAVNAVNGVNAGNPNNNNNINGFTPQQQQQQQHLLLQQQAMQQAAALQNMQNLYGVNAAAMGMANGIANPLNLPLMQQGLAGNTMINPNDPNAVNAAAAAAAAAAAQMAMNPNLLAANGMMQFNQFNPAMSSPGQQGQGPNGQQQQGQGQPNPNQQFGAGRGGNELNQYPMAPRHQQRNRNNRDRGRGRGPRGDRGRGRNNGHRGGRGPGRGRGRGRGRGFRGRGRNNQMHDQMLGDMGHSAM